MTHAEAKELVMEMLRQAPELEAEMRQLRPVCRGWVRAAEHLRKKMVALGMEPPVLCEVT